MFASVLIFDFFFNASICLCGVLFIFKELTKLNLNCNLSCINIYFILFLNFNVVNFFGFNFFQLSQSNLYTLLCSQ